MKILFLAATTMLLTATAPQANAQSRRAAKIETTTTNPGNTTAPNNTPTLPAEGSKLDYRNPAADPLISIEANKRKPVTDDLQATLVELLELFHETKPLEHSGTVVFAVAREATEKRRCLPQVCRYAGRAGIASR